VNSNWLALLGALLAVLAGGLAFDALDVLRRSERICYTPCFPHSSGFYHLKLLEFGRASRAERGQDRAASETIAALAQKIREYGLFIAAASLVLEAENAILTHDIAVD